MDNETKSIIGIVSGFAVLLFLLLSGVSLEGHLVRQAKLRCLASPQAPTVLECKVLFE